MDAYNRSSCGVLAVVPMMGMGQGRYRHAVLQYSRGKFVVLQSEGDASQLNPSISIIVFQFYRLRWQP